jgi:hypothetical protein
MAKENPLTEKTLTTKLVGLGWGLVTYQHQDVGPTIDGLPAEQASLFVASKDRDGITVTFTSETTPERLLAKVVSWEVENDRRPPVDSAQVLAGDVPLTPLERGEEVEA